MTAEEQPMQVETSLECNGYGKTQIGSICIQKQQVLTVNQNNYMEKRNVRCLLVSEVLYISYIKGKCVQYSRCSFLLINAFPTCNLFRWINLMPFFVMLMSHPKILTHRQTDRQIRIMGTQGSPLPACRRPTSPV